MIQASGFAQRNYRLECYIFHSVH